MTKGQLKGIEIRGTYIDASYINYIALEGGYVIVNAQRTTEHTEDYMVYKDRLDCVRFCVNGPDISD